jgi:hypothetical protein
MTHDAEGPSVASDGSQRLIGFAVMGESGQWEATRETLESAEELAAAFSEDEECGFGRCYVVPLYSKPMLEADEREALGGLACYLDMRGNIQLQAWASLLRILMARFS